MPGETEADILNQVAYGFHWCSVDRRITLFKMHVHLIVVLHLANLSKFMSNSLFNT